MIKRNPFIYVFIFLVISVLFCCSPNDEKPKTIESKYEDLVKLFKEWREFQKPELNDGVPNYTASAMEEQRYGLQEFQHRLSAIDPTSWPISPHTEYHIIRPEF